MRSDMTCPAWQDLPFARKSLRIAGRTDFSLALEDSEGTLSVAMPKPCDIRCLTRLNGQLPSTGKLREVPIPTSLCQIIGRKIVHTTLSAYRVIQSERLHDASARRGDNLRRALGIIDHGAVPKDRDSRSSLLAGMTTRSGRSTRSLSMNLDESPTTISEAFSGVTFFAAIAFAASGVTAARRAA